MLNIENKKLQFSPESKTTHRIECPPSCVADLGSAFDGGLRVTARTAGYTFHNGNTPKIALSVDFLKRFSFSYYDGPALDMDARNTHGKDIPLSEFREFVDALSGFCTDAEVMHEFLNAQDEAEESLTVWQQ